MTDTADFIRALADAITAGTTYPRFPAGLDLAAGEALQADLVAALGGAAGLKAGLGEVAAQEALGVQGPMLGHLYAGRQLDDGAELAADPVARIECELGLRLSGTGEVIGVQPAVEIVRPEFAVMEDLTGPNLAACNVAADRFMVGPERPLTDTPVGTVTVSCDGEVILDAALEGSLGGPDSAAAWMVGEATRRGIDLWDGVLFITGTCGEALPLRAGSYEADFDDLGALRFTAR